MGAKQILKSRRFYIVLAMVIAFLGVAGYYSFAATSSSQKADDVINTAKSKIGSKYAMGAEGDDTFDCSGFVWWTFQKKNGVKLAAARATADDYASIGTEVGKNDLQKGDLVFFEKDSKDIVHHVGIYIGGGNFIQSSQAYGKVLISNLNDHLANPNTHRADGGRKTYNQIFAGARRVLGGGITSGIYNTSDSTNSPTLKLGDSGSGVSSLQRDLNSIGYRLTVDGKFEQLTEEAIKDLQNKYNLTPDGIVSPQIWEVIRELQSQLRSPGTMA